MNKKIFTILFYLFTAISATLSAQSYSGGSGTEADPYFISSKADMEALATAVNGGNNYFGKYFLLTQDITDTVTTIIGNSNNIWYLRPFSGIFDGGGHKINVNINDMVDCAGVFGYASRATIKNLGVAGNISFFSSSNRAYVGGICGYADDYTTISNCYNTGNISFSTNGDAYAGGICGSCGYYATITYCCNTGNISSSASSFSYGNAYAGGICGNGSTVSYCYNTGNIFSSSANSYAYAGGICGNGGIIANNCIATNATITAQMGDNNNSTYAGRIIGNSGTVQNCYALTLTQINDVTKNSQDATSKDGRDLIDFTGPIGLNEFESILVILNRVSGNMNYGDVINLNENNFPVIFQSSDDAIAEISNNILTAKKAGSVTITANYNSENANYQFNIQQIINKVTLTAQADTITSIYGNTIPQFTCHYAGFLNGENESVVTTPPSYSCSGTSTSNVGNYIITPSGAEADNYTFTYENGLLQIGKRDLKVIPDNFSRVYGDNNPVFTLSYEGFVNGDTKENVII